MGRKSRRESRAVKSAGKDGALFSGQTPDQQSQDYGQKNQQNHQSGAGQVPGNGKAGFLLEAGSILEQM